MRCVKIITKSVSNLVLPGGDSFFLNGFMHVCASRIEPVIALVSIDFALHTRTNISSCRLILKLRLRFLPFAIVVIVAIQTLRRFFLLVGGFTRRLGLSLLEPL